MYGTGISKTGDLLDVALQEKIINKSGAWFYYGEDQQRLGQGRENVKQYLGMHPELMLDIENAVREKHGLPLKDVDEMIEVDEPEMEEVTAENDNEDAPEQRQLEMDE